jgi:GcrA cell cycle regulator
MGKVFWTGEKLAGAIRLWKDGARVSEIALQFDTTDDSVSGLIARSRHLFPKRKSYIKRCERPAKARVDIVRVEPCRPDRVTRTTISGAKVTLPRVPFIDGHVRSNELAGEAR